MPLIPPLKSKKVLGISFESSGFKGALLSLIGETVEVEKLLSFPPEEKEAFEREVYSLVNQDPEILVAGAIPAEKTTVREVLVGVGEYQAAVDALPFQLEPLLPYPLEDSLYHFEVIEQSKGETRFSCLCTQKKDLETLFKSLSPLGELIELVTFAPAALASLTDQSPLAFSAYSAGETATCTLAKRGIPLSSRTFTLQTPEDLSLEVSRSYDSMTRKLKAPEEAEVFFLGAPVEEIEGTSYPFSDRFSSSHPEGELEGCALPIGVARVCLETTDSSPFVLAEDRPQTRQLTRIRNKLIPTLLLYAACLVLFYLALNRPAKNAELYAHQVFKDLTEEVGEGKEGEELLETSPPPYALIEASEEYKGKVFTQQFPFPLLPIAPNVSQTLAFLASHPMVVGESGEKLIDIFNFRYTLVSQPTKQRPKDPYKIKIELEFTAAAPKNARDFYESLQEKNALVDPRSPIDWSPRKESYKISFILKDLTPYS